MLKKKLFSLLALILLFASCANEVDKSTRFSLRALKDTDLFYATIVDSSDPETKVFADSQMRVLWNADDRITIFKKYTYRYQYRFTGNEGANAGGFSLVPSDDEFITGQPLDYNYAVYPYSPHNDIDYEGVLTLNLPETQYYKENSFGPEANVMLAVSADNLLQFKNVGGFLSFKFYGAGASVKSIMLKGNNHEKLAVTATVTMPVDGLPIVTLQDTALEAITLTCDTPVALGPSAEDYTEFWFVLPPTTFSHGFTVTVTDKQGGAYVETTQNEVVITRNALSRMQPLQIIPTPPLSEAVDLGLSIKWATCNVGASSPEEYGDYFAWGETSPKERYYWSTYEWCNGSDNTLTKYNYISDYGVVDNKLCLELSDDAARINCGGSWRMPTLAEWEELRYECDWTWMTQRGKNGFLVTSRTNGNSIFLPAAGERGGNRVNNSGSDGMYWSSALDSIRPTEALILWFFNHYHRTEELNRYVGLPVRPVTDY